jgi:hypothetical protein
MNIEKKKKHIYSTGKGFEECAHLATSKSKKYIS